MSHPRFKPLSFLPFLSFYLLLLHCALGVDPISLSPLQCNCSGGSYAKGSAFETNLNTLFSSLNSKSPASNFYNDTAGTGSDRVYGLFLCQGDLSHTDCQACIKNATADIPTKCSQRQAVIYYDYCHLRYSDRDFFGVMDSDGFSMINSNNVSDPERVLGFVSELVKEAPFQRPMFAANASLRHHLFAMAECTMDITSDDCAKCLNEIFWQIKSCCSGYKGWRFLSPSCSIRYEAVSFLRNPKFASSEIVETQCSDNKLPSGDVNLQQNLNSLLSSLPNKARASGFYNTTVGGDPDQLYGLALCRSDLPRESEACQNCLEDAAADAADECPNNTQAIIWHEKCFLRYSNRNFFGVVDSDGKILCNPLQNPEAEDAAVIRMMTSLVDRAAEGLHAADKVTVGNETGYGLMQCTGDLSSEGCKDCLTEAMRNVTRACKQRKGWRVLSGSCTARYEGYAFFNTSILAADASGRGNATSSPTIKDGSSVCRPNFMAMALLFLLLISSMAGLGQR